MVIYAYKANIQEAEGREYLQIQGQLFGITNSGLIWGICKDIVSKLCIKYKYIQNVVLPYDYVYLFLNNYLYHFPLLLCPQTVLVSEIQTC